ncbi:ATP F0F1 synthase subunit alpha [Mycoplasmopsis agassizii]|uniref:ATP F0F1 synthase subunit alpha n=1 Tax=Mycoplasmopsis agassizii TaxID=33922 RepID=A0A269TJ76_9BACT|nr:ATP F0F1 synthase subunit alpha [Mycoplasmopsis agassizii]PAK20938.1 ATP F0F1 synthase subunit alpha [Mycoplasmopsis agassizii]
MIKIKAIADFIIEVEGIYPYQEGQFFTIKNKPNTRAYLITAEYNKAYLLVDRANQKLVIGDELVETKELRYVKTSRRFFGNIINIDGQIVLPEVKNVNFDIPTATDIFSTPENMVKRQQLNKQLYTGILGIDLFTPIGLGQRELIVGDRKTGKTHVVLNTIINQAKSGVKCIYVAIGQKRETVSYVYQVLKAHKALDYTIIVDAPSTSSYQQFLAPYIAMAHAENLSYTEDVLIIFDDLTQHANVYREISLLIDKPIGKEAFPADVFFLHSRLLEKSGRFIDRKSITCLPIVKTLNNDLTSLISSNIISITDGQIVLDSELFAQGKMPAVNFDLSVSRTGTAVQEKHISKIASQISKIYLAYKKQIRLANLDYDLNRETANLIFKGKEIEKMLIQKGFGSYSDELLLIMIKLTSWGILQHVDNPDAAKDFISSMIKTDKYAISIFKNLASGANLDDKLIRNYFASAINQYIKYLKLDNFIPLEVEYIKFNDAELNAIIKNIRRF